MRSKIYKYIHETKDTLSKMR